MITLADRVASVTDISLSFSDDSPFERDVDPSILAAVQAALLEGETHYTVRPGIPELRRKIAMEIEMKGGPPLDAERPEDNILITNGDSESFFVVLLGLGSSPGEILLSSNDPIPYPALLRLMGFQVRDASQPTAAARLTYRRWSSPRSAQKDLQALADVQGIPDVLDLESALWSPSLVAFPPVKHAHTLIMGNLNALPGMSMFPIAFLMGPKAYMARCRPWKQALSICSAAPSQRAALGAIAASYEEEAR